MISGRSAPRSFGPAGGPAPGAPYGEVEKRADPEAFREDLRSILGLLAAGKIQPLITERLELQQAARARELLESGGVSGKVVLVCDRAIRPPKQLASNR